jgi:mannosyl-3-phosphoglycerate synthase
MRIEGPRYTERFGAVRIDEVQKVLELDSGRAGELSPYESVAVQKIEEDVIKDFEEKMLIVIPTKDEKLKLLEGVISGIPHECQILVVSNSQRKRVDRFKMEEGTLNQYCHFTQRQAYLIHQKDTVLAKALSESGYKYILDKDGLVRDGKAEGMIAAIFIAMMMKKEYIGFIDADNFSPGAVWEYVKCYASGFYMAGSPYAMVRIIWRYKPKIGEGVYFRKWGRVSEVTNRCMNSLVSVRTGFETDIIKTSNAGEHAMSLKLAELISYASRFAVEPQELVSIFEGFGGVLPMACKSAAKYGVEILQIETRNPHIHEDRGTEHLRDMLLPGLATIYHSKLCEKETKEKVMSELVQQGAIGPDEEPPKPQICPPPKNIDIQKFTKAMEGYIETRSALRSRGK